jgi:hypothetical protein
MHLGMKSLELLVPGGVEKLETDLERIANGIRKLDEEESEHQVDEASAADARASRLVKVIGDPWLWVAHPTLLGSFVYALSIATTSNYPATGVDDSVAATLEFILSLILGVRWF